MVYVVGFVSVSVDCSVVCCCVCVDAVGIDVVRVALFVLLQQRGRCLRLLWELLQ